MIRPHIFHVILAKLVLDLIEEQESSLFTTKFTKTTKNCTKDSTNN
jgi:hypothetical protein